jgi:histidyl-tRNA synthetase
MIQRPQGTIDILPEDMPIWQYIESTARRVAESYGFKEIRFPTFEYTELFQRGVGDTTDVVQKEMYTFNDREKRTLTLRPEGTASVARMVIEHGKYSDTMPLKYFYFVNCFRHEKPQAGRSREFFQFGVELFGAPSAAADVTVISIGDTFVRALGITDDSLSLHINSIGCPTCRPNYHKVLKEYLRGHIDELCDTCKSRFETNPLRILDCKSPVCSKIADAAPKSIEHLCDECDTHFKDLKGYLDAIGIKYSIDPRIVRGLDYYTRTVFEFIVEGIGAQNTVCGGGRYDGLIESVGGPQLAGIGFAMGITRLILAMKQAGIEIKDESQPILYIAPMGDAAKIKAISITETLRKNGIYAECDVVGRSLKAQMKYANKINAKYTLILGDSELESGKGSLRNMTESSQTEIDLNDIESLIKLI